MKSLIAVVALVFIILLIFVSSYVVINDDNRFEDNWYLPTSDGSFDGSWSTQLLVNFEDGTSESLRVKPLWFSPLDVSFHDKKVSSIMYVLSTNIQSTVYDQIQIDLSSFSVETSVTGIGTGYGTVYKQDTIWVAADGKWHEIFSETISSDELIDLPMDYQYNMSFTPTGSCSYRVSSSSNWVDLPLPGWHYLVFSVESEIEDIIEDEEPDIEKWIQVDLSSEESS